MVGTIRGKAGNFVFAKGEDGSTIVRAYQPQVTNPNTDAQILQRAKLNLAGRLSKITPKGVIIGMNGATNRKRRSRYNALIVKNCLTQLDGTEGTARITAPRLILSEGKAFNYGLQVSITEGRTSVDGVNRIVVNRTIATEAIGHYAERIVAVVCRPENEMYKMMTYKDVVYNTAATGVGEIPVGELEEGDIVNVYVIPMDMDNAVAGVDYQGVIGGPQYTSNFNIISNTSKALGNSVYVGRYVKSE